MVSYAYYGELFIWSTTKDTSLSLRYLLELASFKEDNIHRVGIQAMSLHVPQWSVAKSVVTLAIGLFIIVSDLYAILECVTIPLLSIVIETVCRNVVVARQSPNLCQR